MEQRYGAAARIGTVSSGIEESRGEPRRLGRLAVKTSVKSGLASWWGQTDRGDRQTRFTYCWTIAVTVRCARLSESLLCACSLGRLFLCPLSWTSILCARAYVACRFSNLSTTNDSTHSRTDSQPLPRLTIAFSTGVN